MSLCDRLHLPLALAQQLPLCAALAYISVRIASALRDTCLLKPIAVKKQVSHNQFDSLPIEPKCPKEVLDHGSYGAGREVGPTAVQGAGFDEEQRLVTDCKPAGPFNVTIA
jgi:hypothetical protein